MVSHRDPSRGLYFFLFYVSDLPENLSSRSSLYADDLKIWSARDPNSLQMDVDAVFQWSEVWKLPLNLDKCTHISVGGDSGNLSGFDSLNWIFFHQNCRTSEGLGKPVHVLSDVHSTQHGICPPRLSEFCTRYSEPSLEIFLTDVKILHSVYIRSHLEFGRAITFLQTKFEEPSIEVQRQGNQDTSPISNPFTTKTRKRILGPSLPRLPSTTW